MEIRSKIAQATASHSIWRKHVGFGHVTVDLSWKAGWPPLADAVLQLLEELSMKNIVIRLQICMFDPAPKRFFKGVGPGRRISGPRPTMELIQKHPGNIRLPI